MKNKRLFIPIIIVLAVAGIIIGMTHVFGEKNGEVRGSIKDAYNGESVWNAQITVGNKTTFKYTSTSYSLTEIPPGSYTLKAVAPNYYDFEKSIEVKPGRNGINIVMKGKEIPDLKGILIFAISQKKGMDIEIRLTDSELLPIKHPPGFPFTLEGELFVKEGDDKNPVKGRKIFSGPIDLRYDSKEVLAPNKGLIPWEKIKVNCEKEKLGILKVTLHTPQGRFEKETKEEVELCPNR